MAERALTERPPFDVERYARESEARIEVVPDSRRTTEPPPPEHSNLRESCRELRVSVPPQPDVNVGGAASLTSTPTLGAVAVPLVAREDYAWFDLDERGRAIVSIIDDQLIVEEVLEATHTPVSEGIAVFDRLARLGLVAFRVR
jgi:hypothetical protein